MVAFQRWVCHEVIPAIMDTGRYEVPGQQVSAHEIARAVRCEFDQAFNQSALNQAFGFAFRENLPELARAMLAEISVSSGSDEVATCQQMMVASTLTLIDASAAAREHSESMRASAEAMQASAGTLRETVQACGGTYGMLTELRAEIESLSQERQGLAEERRTYVGCLQNTIEQVRGI